MHWPRKIHTREMLTKETHAAEKFPTPPNTFLMVRFKCCFSMNIISVIQFVLKFSLAFLYRPSWWRKLWVQYVSTLERTVLSPPLTPLKYTLFSHDGVGLRMATWTTGYNLQISLLLSLHKIRSLDFPINLHIAYYN